MTFISIIENAYNSGELYDIVKNSKNLKEVCSFYGYSNHSRNTSYLNKYLELKNIDTSHFVKRNNAPTYEDRICPVCKVIFRVCTSRAKEAKQTTCSHSCANTYFRSGESAGNYKGINAESYKYKTKYSEKMSKCCVCGEQEVLDIHHLDSDRNNNSIDNLIPLCPTHHAYMHRNKAHLIKNKIIDWMDSN